MNSDPHDSTAWRSFGILDTDESAGFDEAMRHDPELKAAFREMDRLSAAVAVATSHPVVPREGHLERIQSRLGLHRPQRTSLWFGISGWAAAAALALLLAWNADGIRFFSSQPVAAANNPTVPALQVPDALPENPVPQPSNDGVKDETAVATTNPSSDTARPGLIIRSETEKLIHEIATLQDQLKSYQQRELAFSQVLPGVALPVIMKMIPPNAPSATDPTLAMNDSPISELLGESLRITTSSKQESGDAPDATASNNTADTVDPALTITTDEAPVTATPGAIPIYDAARDAGTLVVSNLSPAPAGEEYNLWVQTTRDGPPVRLGILPDAGTSPSESFDFNLGSNQVLPSGFILTRDLKDKPTAPHSKNTVLQSPQVANP